MGLDSRTVGDIDPVPFVFFDIETTGLHPNRGARITEVALLDHSGIRLSAEFGDADGRQLPNRLPGLLDQLRSSVVVGHNVRFDLEFVAYEADRLGYEGPDLYFIDTLGLARRLLTRQFDHRLETALHAFHIKLPDPLHTALGDARAVRTLFWRLIGIGDFDTLVDAGLRPLNWTAF